MLRQHGVVTVGGERLEGGNTSLVVRVGDTVRRVSGSWTPVVQELLHHVRGHGFDLAPEPLGEDDGGREMLRFIPGDAVGSRRPWPPWVWSDELLVEAARAARRYHEAVRSFRPAGAVAWRSGTRALADGEIELDGRAWALVPNSVAPELGAGEPVPEDWPVVGQSILGFVTLVAEDRIEYSLADGQVIALYEPIPASEVPGCD